MTGFEGGNFEKVSNPAKNDQNPSNHVGKTFKSDDAETFAGVFLNLPNKIDLSINRFIKMKVYGEKTGIVKVKLEKRSGAAGSKEVNANLTKVNEWQDLVFDFEDTPLNTYDRISLFFDFGKTTPEVFYFDDLIAVSSPTVSRWEALQGAVRIFPNPTKNFLNIEIDPAWATQFHQVPIRLLDLYGRTLQTFSWRPLKGANAQKLEFSPLSPGLYFVEIQAKDTPLRYKIWVE